MANNNSKNEFLEKQLWKAADKLRKNIDAAEYKHMFDSYCSKRLLRKEGSKLFRRPMKMRDLEVWGVPSFMVDIWEKNYSPLLLPVQEEAVREYGKQRDASLFYTLEVLFIVNPVNLDTCLNEQLSSSFKHFENSVFICNDMQ